MITNAFSFAVATAANSELYRGTSCTVGNQLLSPFTSHKSLTDGSISAASECKSFSRVLRFTSGLIEIYNHLSYPPKRKRRCCEALLRYLICYYHYYIILINDFAFSGISIKMLHIGSPSGDCWCCSKIFMTQRTREILDNLKRVDELCESLSHTWSLRQLIIKIL